MNIAKGSRALAVSSFYDSKIIVTYRIRVLLSYSNFGVFSIIDLVPKNFLNFTNRNTASQERNELCVLFIYLFIF